MRGGGDEMTDCFRWRSEVRRLCGPILTTAASLCQLEVLTAPPNGTRPEQMPPFCILPLKGNCPCLFHFYSRPPPVFFRFPLLMDCTNRSKLNSTAKEERWLNMFAFKPPGVKRKGKRANMKPDSEPIFTDIETHHLLIVLRSLRAAKMPFSFQNFSLPLLFLVALLPFWTSAAHLRLVPGPELSQHSAAALNAPPDVVSVIMCF